MLSLAKKPDNVANDAYNRDTSALLCFSHLRWDFVYQRPQHLMSRFAKERPVYFIEEPVIAPVEAWLQINPCRKNLWVVRPHLPPGLSPVDTTVLLQCLLNDLIDEQRLSHYINWYYTPAALPFSHHLMPEAVIYDCMDELSLFKGASAELSRQEAALLEWADLVFTGGPSLYEAKRSRHSAVHLFPSSIDVDHFYQARFIPEAADQAHLLHPRLGFFGVLDERLDIELVRTIATLRPDWQLVLVGPVVKIDPATLPTNANIHYLGMRSYQELPAYLAGWDVALLPFARNESTRFISPTKTPEYLAGGKPVVSTPIQDVITLYGQAGFVQIAAEPAEFIDAVEAAWQQGSDPVWLARVDSLLADQSWDHTWAAMRQLIDTITANQRGYPENV